jgi:hypothetical protein
MLFGAEVAKFPMFYIPTPAHVFLNQMTFPQFVLVASGKKTMRSEEQNA